MAAAPCYALVVAAGRGERFGGALPKQYRSLAGMPVLRHALMRLARHPGIEGVRAVIHDDDRALYDEAATGLELLPPVAGGASRQDSVRLGLESLAALGPRSVLIHDGARPLVAADLIDRILEALQHAPGIVPALPIADTLKRADGERVLETVAREGLYRAQTPQGFDFQAILAAHEAAVGSDATDDAALAELHGLPVIAVPGDEGNLKITTEADLARAERLLAGALIPCTGHGFDVHRFGPGDHVMLCGLRIAFERGLIGHSDADVGLHALTDAILGALGEGDIGLHFPPSDPRWQGADSARFLAHARDLVRAAGGRIAHVDVTIVGERPRIGPHRAAMRAGIALILGLDPRRVSVKATTTEGLGFAGRGEGIAAQATATVLLPEAP